MEAKYEYHDDTAITQFVQQGYALYRNVFEPGLIEQAREYVLERFEKLEQLARDGKIDRDVNGWAVSIMKLFEKTWLYERIIRSEKLVDLMKSYLGPDLALLGYDALWVNVPQDQDPVLLKGTHTDAWTGTGVNTIFAKIFFTDVDKFNGMSVNPASHLQGMMPVRNRAVDPAARVNFESRNLDMCKAGDLLIWHSLLLHSTTGHSDRNIRVSMTSRFISMENELTTQERGLGYRPLCVGPLHQVLRLIGNDHLTPFRTLGGYVGVDRRISDIYNHSQYKQGVDYEQYLA